jgi:hypothetical protein
VAHLAIRAKLIEYLAVMEAFRVEIQISLKNFENGLGKVIEGVSYIYMHI